MAVDDYSTGGMLEGEREYSALKKQAFLVVQPDIPPTSINSLPNETLASIFEFAAGAAWNEFLPLQARVELTVSQVSRRWQSVALSTPRLWTRIDGVNGHLAPLFASRSKCLPLDIELLSAPLDKIFNKRCDLSATQHSNGPAKRPVDLSHTLSPLVSHTSRWRTLQVECTHMSEFDLLLAPAPQLETLHIAVSRPEVRPLGAPRELFSGQTPSLRDLSFTGFHPNLTGPLFAGLKALRLAHLNYTADSLPRFLLNLAACPSLEHLGLAHLSFSSGARLDDPHSIPLPHLRSMELRHIDESTRKCILSSIHAPPSLHLSLVSHGNGDELHHIFPRDFDFSVNLPNLPLVRFLAIEHSIRQRSCTVSGKVSEDATDSLFDALFEGESVDFMEKLFHNVGRIFPFRDVEALSLQCDVRGYECPLPSSLAALLRGFPSLRVLALDSYSPAYLDKLIITPASCPSRKLHTLRIANSNVTEEVLMELARSRTNPESLAHEDVVRLRILELSGYHGIPQDRCQGVKRALKDLALDVRWDQYGMTQMEQGSSPLRELEPSIASH
ncbi:hypothetical protein BOTBODRAFT_246309 [Botryobasidium botryosum FD-172 SS1]|uniref:F-box domain-containing protein n=1 Tax=Botryobasidium botryosum (strain FD-172 SS1) TaxID=930990 RepID=A0A067M4S3_BOTB1|nr:hypothetical protein BOTBODRAFT_246309 [Botryobasidium botryosum FD-172 SS1]